MKHATAQRQAMTGDEAELGAPVAEADEDEEEGGEGAVTLTPERIAELAEAAQMVLTISSEGFGKRTLAYDYRRSGRGGRGLLAHDLSRRGGRLVASFPVDDTDEILLVTDQGQLIRVPVAQVSIARRNTQGVTIFRTADNEHVVSVERLEGEAGSPEGDAPAADPEETNGGNSE